MPSKYSLELRASCRIVILVTNQLNGLLLEKPVIIEVDPDHTLHTETISVSGPYESQQEAFDTAIRMYDQIEAAVLEALRETSQNVAEQPVRTWFPGLPAMNDYGTQHVGQ